MGIDCLLGDLNGWVGDKVRVGITDAFGVPYGNGNLRKVCFIICRM